MKKMLALAALVVVLAGIGVGFAPAEKAHAWSWDPKVTLQGKVGCNYSTTNTPQGLYLRGTNGEAGYAWLGSGGTTKPYSYTFTRVPSGGMTVTASWRCSGSGNYSTSFSLSRPSWGTTATRNICHWRPCYL